MWIVDVGAQRNPIKYTAVEKRAKENEHKELPSFFIYILFLCSVNFLILTFSVFV